MIDTHIKTRTGRSWLEGAVVAVAFSALILLLLTPISDSDLWWHLATGRYLVAAKGFLTADPFGLTRGDITPGREQILNGYWLSQVLFYGVYKVGGLAGFVVLRAVLLLLPALTVLFYGWRRYHRSTVVLFLALLCGWGMVYVSGIRPNHLTVALVPFLFILLEQSGFAAEWQGEGSYNLRRTWMLPLLALVWANLHGGFILAVIVVWLYAAGETVTLLLTRQSLRIVAPLWLVAVATFLTSLVSPSGFSIYYQYLSFQGSVLQQKTSEYLSPFMLVKSGILYYWPYFIFILLFLVVLVGLRGKITSTRLLLLLALLLLSSTAFRYTPLFIGAAAILLIPALQKLCGQLRSRQLVADISTVAVASVLVFMSVFWYSQKAGALSEGVIDQYRFPVLAADFVKMKGLSGNILTHFNWGGYFDWREPDQLKTFIDGRSLNLLLFHEYTRVLWLPQEMQAILDRRQVDQIVMPRLNPFSGELYALTDYLWKSPLWVQVYRDSLASVFVRAGRYPDLERDSVIAKAVVYEDVLRDIDRLRMQTGRQEELDKAARLAAIRLAQSVSSMRN